MATVVEVPIPTLSLSSNVAAPSNNGFTPVSNWFSAGALQAARATYEVHSRLNEIEMIPAVQFANSVREKLTDVSIGSTWASANGYADPTGWTDLTSYADASQQARLGWITRNTQSTGFSSAEVFGAFDLQIREYDEIAIQRTTLVANGKSPTFYPASDWMNAADALNARAVVEVRGLTGKLSVRAGYQLANDPAKPEKPGALGAAATADGISFPTAFEALAVGRHRYIRFGWIAERTSDAAMAYATASGVAELCT